MGMLSSAEQVLKHLELLLPLPRIHLANVDELPLQSGHSFQVLDAKNAPVRIAGFDREEEGSLAVIQRWHQDVHELLACINELINGHWLQRHADELSFEGIGDVD